MRASHVATALAAFTAGLTAATVRHRRLQLQAPAAEPTLAAPVESSTAAAAVEPAGIVVPFLRTVPTPPTPVPAQPARCGDSGGLTKAGAPCAARATSAGRCHHHPLAVRASA